MQHLPNDCSDEEILEVVDRWAALLEREDYSAAFACTDHVAESQWTPELIREVIQAYGEPGIARRVTVEGRPTDVSQRKEIVRRRNDARRYIGYVWYDLNLNGFASDLTATFDLIETDQGLSVQLNDIHVM
jgi:hypothetical protein